VRSRFSIIGLIASHLAVLGTVITGTLYGEVPARNHIDGCCAGSLLYRSSNRDTAFTPFQATLESGVVLLAWQPGASIILEKSSLDDSGITGEPATALAGHIDTSAYPGGPNDSVMPGLNYGGLAPRDPQTELLRRNRETLPQLAEDPLQHASAGRSTKPN
jgi:hypothetical protein